MSHVETAWVISRLLDDITALTAERDAAVATATRWEQRAHDLETLARAPQEPTP